MSYDFAQGKPRGKATGKQITKRKLLLLQMLADGETKITIRKKLTIKRSTLNNMLARCRKMFDVHTTMHAVATALRRGLID